MLNVLKLSGLVFRDCSTHGNGQDQPLCQAHPTWQIYTLPDSNYEGYRRSLFSTSQPSSSGFSKLVIMLG